MGRRNKDITLYNLKIESVAAEGKSIARTGEQVVFVKEAVPGDVVDIRVTRKKKSFMEGYPILYHTYSDKRVEPFCEHFGVCGGCKWQHLDYEAQLEYKHQQVVDNLQRIGKVEIGKTYPILRSEKTKKYRNKLEFTFSNKRWLKKEEIQSEEPLERNALGFHIPRLFDKIVDIEQCHLMEEPTNKIKNVIRKYALENGISFFDIRKQTGLLRTLMIRITDFGEIMVLVQFAQNDVEVIKNLLSHVRATIPEITSLLYVINNKGNDTFNDLEVITFGGKDHIIEEMNGIKFKIDPKSFYQTNSAQAHNLYQVVADFADFKGDELVYDLYTGTGTIANFCASKVGKIIGLEYVPEAIEDAKENSSFNNISNTDFFAGDMKDLLNEAFIEKHGKPDVVITDPPRAGMHENVVDLLMKVEPEKIVYVSCNPATQARDIHLMSSKYTVEKIQPVDMFPQTHHVENVALLVLK
ncbi:23S rRNA (uracil(1939)-C(5))-methyltransferase RlmD [Reichenbachiella sp. MALMAid0571]|uniref:23S rRNA (uracil(1939)-C(5))-methyltransferase RlmD n=1 Tax=Reichenbachiella sp. MALMAid0571 TaxID=3143939 RepID=UPI0032E051CF